MSAPSRSSSSTRSTSATPSSPRDFEHSYGTLQTTYGLPGVGSPWGCGPLAMSPKKKEPQLAPPQSHQVHTVVFSTSTKNSSSGIAQTSTKNFEAAFGKLSSSHGFGGSAMILPDKSDKTSSKNARGFMSGTSDFLSLQRPTLTVFILTKDLFKK